MEKFKVLQFGSLEEAINTCWEEFSKSDISVLFIFDIDGVFFEGLKSINTYTNQIKKRKLDYFKKITGLNTSVWVFTNRNKLLLKPVKQQLNKALERNGTKVVIVDNKTELKKNSDLKNINRAIIYSADKKGKDAEATVSIALNSFKKIYYFAGQDFSWRYEDLNLLERVAMTNPNITKLTFLDIRKKD